MGIINKLKRFFSASGSSRPLRKGVMFQGASLNEEGLQDGRLKVTLRLPREAQKVAFVHPMSGAPEGIRLSKADQEMVAGMSARSAEASDRSAERWWAFLSAVRAPLLSRYESPGDGGWYLTMENHGARELAFFFYKR